jgi:hypothetical protein
MFFVVLLHFVFYTIAFPNTIAGNMVTTACAVCVARRRGRRQRI